MSKEKRNGEKKELASKPQQEVEPSVAYVVADAMDEKQIRAMLTGEKVKDWWCYHFQVSGRDIYGIGWSGAKELAKMSGGIFADPKTPPTVIKEDKNTIKVASYAVLVRDGRAVFGVWGVAEQSKWKKLKDGRIKFDEKAFIVATSKAQRNAILSLLSEDIKEKAIEEWKKKGKVKTITEAEIEEIKKEEEEEYTEEF